MTVSTRDVPWAGMGTVVEEAMTAEEAITLAGLDWDVKLAGLFWRSGGYERIKDRFGVVKEEAGQPDVLLSTVGSKYEVFQNREAFAFVDSLVGEAGLRFHTAGPLRHGKVVFLAAKLPDGFTVLGDDRQDLYLFLRTSHDGSTSVQVYVTVIREACTNAMTVTLRNASHKWTAAHTRTLQDKVGEARHTLQLTSEYVKAFEEEADILASTPVTEERLRVALTKILPDRPKTQERVEQVVSLMRSSESIPDDRRLTAWGALNAVTEWCDHLRDVRSGEARITSAVGGSSDKLRSRVVRELTS